MVLHVTLRTCSLIYLIVRSVSAHLRIEACIGSQPHVPQELEPPSWQVLVHHHHHQLRSRNGSVEARSSSAFPFPIMDVVSLK